MKKRLLTLCLILALGASSAYASFPTTFATLSGNQPLSLLDNMFSVVGSMGQIMCMAAGTNTIALTPLPNMPTVGAYSNYQAFGFVAVNASTGFVTVNVSGVGALPLYMPDGVTQAGSGSINATTYYLIIYNLALAGGSGGFQIVSPTVNFWQDRFNFNTAIGYTNFSNTISQSGGGTNGQSNTSLGYLSLNANTTGSFNTAIGQSSLLSNTVGQGNTAVGPNSMGSNLSGGNNVAIGLNSLDTSIIAVDTVAIGAAALSANTASFNTAVGEASLQSNTTGVNNTAVGFNAGNAGTANTVGTNNTYVGYQAQANAANYTNSTALGNSAIITQSNAIVLGNSSISKILAQVTTITGISDRRKKKDIAPLNLGLDFIDKLKPVSYRYNNGDETLRLGLVAQEVEKSLPDSLKTLVNKENGLALLDHDKTDTYHLGYDQLIAPLILSVQQLHQENDYLKEEINSLKAKKK